MNINNVHPTISINKTIDLFNSETGSSLPPLTVEHTLARTFNCLEKLLTVYEVEGVKSILDLYYKYWLHRYVQVYVRLCHYRVFYNSSHHPKERNKNCS